MIKAFLEVLNDLWGFIFAGSGSVDVSSSRSYDSKPYAPVLQSKAVDGSYSEETAYVCIESAPYFIDSDLSFDSKLGEFCYGDKVTVLHFGDFYSEVRIGTIKGWTKTVSLTQDEAKIIPDLETMVPYTSDNEESVKLRKYIKDEVLAGQLKLPLQSVELIYFLLKKKGLEVNWPQTRPRAAGMWSSILKGVKGVSIGINPRTNSIIEYAENGTRGHIGFIESVHPDLSITMKSIGRIKPGEYRIEEFTHSEWKEWRPVFLSF